MLTYDPEICKKIVEPLIPKIEEKFSKFLILDYRKIYTFDDQINNQKSMPRVSLLSSFIPCSSFYYVNFLTEQQPEEIIDLGCGPNFFKNILPNVVGIDPVGKWADIVDMFDDEFIKNHYESYNSVLSIDALHFVPITQFADRVKQFYSIIKPGGRGYLSLNAKRMVEFSRYETENLFETSYPTAEQTQDYVWKEINNQLQHIDFLVCDILITEKFDEMIDGNIRLVLEKT